VTGPAEKAGLEPEIRIYRNGPDLFSATAECLASFLEAALSEKRSCSFVLTGGITPHPVYGLLSDSPLSKRIDWARLHFFWGDERCVPPDHKDSNFRMARDSLLSKISISSDRFHRIRAESEDPGEEARRYEGEIQRFVTDVPVPRFDLVILGMGDDGHTASLFPGTHWDENRLVVANFVPRLGSWRITMTPRLLNAAHRVVFLISGQAKAKALAGVLEGAAGVYPAQEIHPASGSLTWMVDVAAASLLFEGRSRAVYF
jgi:6-phosphogluconolactonase